MLRDNRDSSFLVRSLVRSFHVYVQYSQQRSKLTFSKNRLLAALNFKMVAIERNSVAKKTLRSGGHFMTYYTKG